jgi:Big-like domain-containing protein
MGTRRRLWRLRRPRLGTVSGASASVSASASDNVGVSGVQFKLDGANLASEDTSAPYSVTWDTTTVANGSDILTDMQGHVIVRHLLGTK